MRDALELAAKLLRARPWESDPKLDDVMQRASLYLRFLGLVYPELIKACEVAIEALQVGDGSLISPARARLVDAIRRADAVSRDGGTSE